MLVEARDHLGVVFDALSARGWNGEGRQVERVGGGKAGSVFDVRENDSYLHTGQPMFADGLCDREKVGASAGEEDTEALHDKSPFLDFR